VVQDSLFNPAAFSGVKEPQHHKTDAALQGKGRNITNM
jgi:hypothetical protein